MHASQARHILSVCSAVVVQSELGDDDRSMSSAFSLPTPPCEDRGSVRYSNFDLIQLTIEMDGITSPHHTVIVITFVSGSLVADCVHACSLMMIAS